TYVVQVIQDRTPEVNTLSVFLSVLGVGGLLAVTASLLAGAGYATRALVPIRDALRRQREFAADASHELRTPLTVVRGNVELVRRRVIDDPTSASLLDEVDVETIHLAALVDDLLLLARTDSGAVQLTAASLDLADVALDAMPSLSGLATSRGVTLELEAAPAPVIGDPVRLRQLVTVLVDNGVRHSPRGGQVTIRVHPDGNRSALEVIDDGPGVRPEDAPHIFDRFWRSPTAPAGGTGLGLAIASWIVEQHDGSISMDRAPGRGARFVARLPLDRGSAAPSRQGTMAPEPR
ncbi:MAG: HAMP domain-containing histidine kinase, partial [Chloroflexi bacterium]|nr:HAMP domain-containing histidine kinase [Chloroflexota bacterium]